MDIKGQFEELQSDVEKSVIDVLRSGKYILGPNVRPSKAKPPTTWAPPASVGVANGTDGLTIALRAAGIGAGDEVVTTPFTFYATAEAIVQAGARPVFVDIDPDTLNIDPQKIAAAVTAKTKAIMPVDIFGLPADADAIAAVARKHGLIVVEDACQAFGADYFGRKAGSLGDLAVFSFFPTKNLGGYGDGGLVTGTNAELVDAARVLRFHGSRDKKTFEYIGFNSRLDELQAAVLRQGIKKIDDWNLRRAQVAEWYDLYLPDEVRAARRARRLRARLSISTWPARRAATRSPPRCARPRSPAPPTTPRRCTCSRRSRSSATSAATSRSPRRRGAEPGAADAPQPAREAGQGDRRRGRQGALGLSAGATERRR